MNVLNISLIKLNDVISKILILRYRRFCLFISVKYIDIGYNRIIQCHCSGNFASKDMMLSVKRLHFEQYNGEVNSKLSFFEIAMTFFDLMSDIKYA